MILLLFDIEVLSDCSLDLISNYYNVEVFCNIQQLSQ